MAVCIFVSLMDSMSLGNCASPGRLSLPLELQCSKSSISQPLLLSETYSFER